MNRNIKGSQLQPCLKLVFVHLTTFTIMFKKVFYFSLITILSLSVFSCQDNNGLAPTNYELAKQEGKAGLIDAQNHSVSTNRISLGLSIQVLSPNWDSNGTTCPDERLELQVFGGTAPYTWISQGATILSGQGTSTLFVRTSGAETDTHLFFKVTDATGKSTSIMGQTDHRACFFLCEEYPELSICDQPDGGGGGQME